MTTYWEGDSLVTRDVTSTYNSGQPVVCSRWIDEDGLFVSRFEWGASKAYIAYCERV